MLKLHWKCCVLVMVAYALAIASSNASSMIWLSPEQRVDLAAAICIGTVVGERPIRSTESNTIYTESLIRVDESLKGIFPKIVRLVHRGGKIGNESEMDGFSPKLIKGEQYLLYLGQRRDGTLYALEGGPSAMRLSKTEKSDQIELTLQKIRKRQSQIQSWGVDVMDQEIDVLESAFVSSSSAASVSTLVATGLITDSVGISSRFTAPDRGQSIPYLIDAELLPNGITLEEATNAVANAFRAWSEVTSLKFRFDGFQIFGQAANDVPDNFDKILVQLHDKHGAISSGTALGIGGRSSFSDASFPMGGLGGRVGPDEFQISGRGFVVLKHTSPTMSNLFTFEEVLCHEIGHALSMAHSSENPSETDDFLKEAIMYFRVHADDRGAILGDYDPPIIQQVYPESNTPPYGFDRVIYAITSFTPLSHPEVNQVEVKGYDLQGDPLTRILLNESALSGLFNLDGDIVTYIPNAPFADTGLIDPEGNSFFDRVHVRFDDGTNMSPPIRLRVLRFSLDTRPSGMPDGIPDNWMNDNFGNITPINGVSGAEDDPDGDGLSNIHEYQGDFDPLDPGSTFKIVSFTPDQVQWTARPFELYEVLKSADASSLVLATSPVLPTTDLASAFGIIDLQSPNQFLSIRKVP